MATDAGAPLVVAVAGATGRFGAIVELLRERGHAVRALTRDPSGPAAGRLRRLGAEPAYADFDDPASIAAAAAGADAVFASGTAHRAGPEGELRHGLNLAAGVAEAAAAHLVYVSGDGAAPDSQLPLFRAKFAVEERIRSLAIPHTILAPTYLMENLFNPWNLPHLRAGTLPSPIPISRPLQQAALADVLALAVRVIERPGTGRERIAVASDELSAAEAAAALAEVTGRELEPAELDRATLPAPLASLFWWLETSGHAVDVEALHERHPEIPWHGFGDWARSVRERFCPHQEPHAVAPL